MELRSREAEAVPFRGHPVVSRCRAEGGVARLQLGVTIEAKNETELTIANAGCRKRASGGRETGARP